MAGIEADRAAAETKKPAGREPCGLKYCQFDMVAGADLRRTRVTPEPLTHLVRVDLIPSAWAFTICCKNPQDEPCGLKYWQLTRRKPDRPMLVLTDGACYHIKNAPAMGSITDFV